MEREEIIRRVQQQQQQVPLVAPGTEARDDIRTADMDWASTSAAPLPTPSAVPTHPAPGWHGFGSHPSTSSMPGWPQQHHGYASGPHPWQQHHGMEGLGNGQTVS